MFSLIQLPMEALAGEYIEKKNARGKIPPIKPCVQASSILCYK